MLTLSPRLATVASHVLDGEPFADIGTDHGYLPAYLVASGRVPRAIAGDLVPGPLEAARSTLAETDLAPKVELRLGSGLTILKPGEVACAAICGMGGPLIAEILATGPLEGIRRLVLQPMGGEERLRQWLMGHGWRLLTEELVADAGRLYVVLVAERGSMTLTEAELVAGPYLLQQGGPLFLQYVEAQLELARQALAGARRSDRPEAQQRAAALSERVQLLEGIRSASSRSD